MKCYGREDELAMTLAETFDLCQEIELRHAKLYATLSVRLGDVDERIARFWREMSAEEWQHHLLVGFGRSLCAQTFGLDGPAPQFTDVSIERISETLNEYEERVQAKQVTLNDAFEIAIALETGESDAIYAELVSTIKDAIYQSGKPYLLDRISQMEQDMHDHVNHLIDAAKRFSINPDLVRKAHRLTDPQTPPLN